jgi:hypothetical protein
LAVAPSTVTLAQGGASQNVQVTVTPQNGFSGTVSVALTGLQNGVTPVPASLSVTSGTPATLSLSATTASSISQQAVTFTGTSSGGIVSIAMLQVNVTGTAVSDPFLPVGGSMTHGFYDETRQLLFAANHGLNEIDVISGKNFTIQARVPVHQPWGVDQMADGKTLVIGTEGQEIVTMDEDTYAVTEHPYGFLAGSAFALFFPNVIAMANGKVIMIGQEQGVDSDNILDGGQYLFEWNSNTNTFSQLEPPPSSSTLWESDSLARSADHKWAAFASGNFYLYSSDSDSMTSIPLSTVNPTSISGQISGYALNADGSVIAVASGTQVNFVNRSFAQLGSVSIPPFPAGRTAIQFSGDGTKLYLQYPDFTWIEAVDTTSYSAVGSFSASVNPDADNNVRMLAASAEGFAYIGIDEGIRIVNLNQTPRPNMENEDGVVPNCPTLNNILALNSSVQQQVSQQFTGIDLFVGSQPAPLVNGGEMVSIPASSTAGAADVLCVDPAYGNIQVTPDAVSYGTQLVALGANLFPPSGHPVAYVFGYGLSGGIVENPTVTVGGQPALNVTSLYEYNFGTLEAVGFQLPDGTPGGTASISLTSSVGTGELATPITYYAAPTILPATGLLQLLYDTHRNLVYALKATEVDVLNPATLTWNTPIAFPSQATGTFDTMALSPDGTKLVVAGPSSAPDPTPQFIVIDPDGNSAPSVITSSGFGEVYGSITISSHNAVIMPGDPGLVLDLTTSAFTKMPYIDGQVIRSSADGNHIYAIADIDGSGEISEIDPSTYAVTASDRFGLSFWAEAAVSNDGTQVAGVLVGPIGTGAYIGFFTPDLQLVNSNAYPDFSPPDQSGALGSAFSPGGKVLMVPIGDAIELWDAAAGTLRARVMTPEELNVLVYPANAASPTVATDPTGQTIYALSASGLTVLKLPEPMDQMTPAKWPIALHAGARISAFNRSIRQRVEALPAGTKALPVR